MERCLQFGANRVPGRENMEDKGSPKAIGLGFEFGSAQNLKAKFMKHRFLGSGCMNWTLDGSVKNDLIFHTEQCLVFKVAILPVLTC